MTRFLDQLKSQANALQNKRAEDDAQLQRVEAQLVASSVKHDRKEIRHPDRNVLQEVIFTYEAQTRGSVTVVADHDKGMLNFRLVNTAGFEVVQAPWPAARVTTEAL